MRLFKKRVPEKDAATMIVGHVLNEVSNAWPNVQKSIFGLFGKDFVFVKEVNAATDLFLASITEDIRAVKNIFPQIQADRIRGHVYACLNIEGLGEYGVKEVQQYEKYLNDNMENMNNGGDPLGAIPSRLLYRWTGNNIERYLIRKSETSMGVVSPMLILAVSGIIAAFTGKWKKMKDNFKLV